MQNKIYDKKFSNIKTLNELCNILDIKEAHLKYLLFVRKNLYYNFSIPKKCGGYRVINSPTFELKAIQKRLADILYNEYDFLETQHGFVKGRSCVTNAQKHLNKRYVFNIDIENFFGNIHFGRVRGMFMSDPFKFSSIVATFLAKLVCYEGSLPQGAPTSPVISNIICFTMDLELKRLANNNKCVYTRYADDITFSSNSEKFSEKIATYKDDKIYVSDKVLEILSGGYKSGFKINDKKTKLSRKNFRQEVTGIKVNEKLNLKKEYIKNIRAILNSISKIGICETYKKNFEFYGNESMQYMNSKLYNYLVGKINYLKMVRGYNDLIFLKYAKKFNEAFSIDYFDISTIDKIEKYASDRCFLIQSEAEDSQGTGFFIKGMGGFTSTHIFINKTTSPEFIHDIKNQNFSSQFPLQPSDGKLPFFKIRNKEKQQFLDYNIDFENYKTDILNIKPNNFEMKKFELSKKNINIGDEIYLIGYPGFVDFERSHISIIPTKVIGKSSLFGRDFIKTNFSPQHGMSGGPVLNNERKVVGIVYAGTDLSDDFQSDNVGFISFNN